VEAPRVRAVVPLSIITLLVVPEVVVNETAPVKALEELSKVITLSLTFVVKLEVSFTVNAPVWVMVPPVAAIRVPCMSDTPKIRFVVPLLMLTFPVVPSCKVLNETSPVKALVAVDKVMALFATLVVKLEAPGTVNAPPVCVIAPPAMTVKVLVPRLDAPKSIALTSVIATAFAPVLVRDTAPLKSLLFVRVITPAPALIVTAPVPVVIVVAPFWVNAPVQVIVNVPAFAAVMDTVSSTKVLLSVMEIAFAPVLVSLTAPLKSLGWVKVITPAPALMMTNPVPEVMAPLWVRPMQVTVNVPAALAMDTVPSIKALVSVMDMLFAPVLVRDTAPVKSFKA